MSSFKSKLKRRLATTTSTSSVKQQPKPSSSPPPPKTKPAPSPKRHKPNNNEHEEKKQSSSSSSSSSKLQQAMRAKLNGAQFRQLNEQLYTTSGSEAFELFQSDPSLFDVYHRGFRLQAEKWPFNPNDGIIAYLSKHPSLVVGDFGCGDARIAEKCTKNKVYSFDLVTTNNRVTACNLSHVPLDDGVLDVAVFCLSLMGTDYASFIQEAYRTLKSGGQLCVVEVESRFGDGKQTISAFINAVCAIGFKLVKQRHLSKLFIQFDFTKTSSSSSSSSSSSRPPPPPPPPLKACQYKKR